MTPKAVVPPPPQTKPYINQGGKDLGFCRDKGIPKEHLKSEWGPPTTIFDVHHAARPVALAEYDKTKDWDIDDQKVGALSAPLKVEELKAALNAEVGSSKNEAVRTSSIRQMGVCSWNTIRIGEVDKQKYIEICD